MSRAGWAAGHEPGAELWLSPARSLGFSSPERGGASEAGMAEARRALRRPDQSPHRCTPPRAREGLDSAARQGAEQRGVGDPAPPAGSQGNVAVSERIPGPRRLHGPNGRGGPGAGPDFARRSLLGKRAVILGVVLETPELEPRYPA